MTGYKYDRHSWALNSYPLLQIKTVKPRKGNVENEAVWNEDWRSREELLRINFQQRYNIDARIERANKLARQLLEPLPGELKPRNAIDDHLSWLRSKPDSTPQDAVQYRKAKSSEQLRIAENLHELYSTAGVLLVDAQGHSSSITPPSSATGSRA